MLLLSIFSANLLYSFSISLIYCFSFNYRSLAASSSLNDLVSSKLLLPSLGLSSSNTSASSYWSRRLSLKLLFLAEPPCWNWWMLFCELLRNLALLSTLPSGSKLYFLMPSESCSALPPLSSSSNIWKCSEAPRGFLLSVWVAESSLFYSFFLLDLSNLASLSYPRAALFGLSLLLVFCRSFLPNTPFSLFILWISI